MRNAPPPASVISVAAAVPAGPVMPTSSGAKLSGSICSANVTSTWPSGKVAGSAGACSTMRGPRVSIVTAVLWEAAAPTGGVNVAATSCVPSASEGAVNAYAPAWSATSASSASPSPS